MTYFVDANIFIRILVKEDEVTFGECVKFLGGVKKNMIKGVTSTLVISEVVWVLGSYYKISKREVVKLVKSILNLPGMKIVDRYNLKGALEWYKTKSIKYIDATIASVPQIQAREWAVVSYDRDFDKLGVMRKEPKEVELDVKVR